MTQILERWKRKNSDQIVLAEPRKSGDLGHAFVLVMRENATASYAAGTQFWISWAGLQCKFELIGTAPF